ncbi:MAG: AMP-binding protein [Pseudomonadota bacterium]
MTDHYDALETRDPAAREEVFFARLPDFLRMATEKAPGWAEQLSGADLTDVRDRAALARLPILRKSDLMARQAAHPPLGGYATKEPGHLNRLFMSPGPIYDCDGSDRDWWLVARALFAAGIREGDIVHNCFAYHLTPAGHMFETGAQALGCAVIPAGTGNTEMQIDAIAHLKPAAYSGTPDYLKILLDAAEAAGKDASSIKRALVSGGALFPSMREDYANRGVHVRQCYGTADLGIVAYESQAMEGMIVSEDMIVEIVTPGTGDPVAPGDVGEIVVTSLNSDYPMIRFATGDMSAVMEGTSPCGRTNMRIKGWMGRADQRVKVKGMFVDPAQIAAVARRHPQLGRVRLVVTRDGDRDAMTLKAEVGVVPDGFAASVAGTLRAETKLGGEIAFVEPGSLPNDGQVIADERDYDA